MNTDTIVDTIEYLDFDFAPPCEASWVRSGKLENHCAGNLDGSPVPAVWRMVSIGHCSRELKTRLLCEKDKEYALMPNTICPKCFDEGPIELVLLEKI